MQAGLYIVATPIGNLADITYRAVEILGQVDAIYCEDTRVTQRLLGHYGIKTTLRVYNDHSTENDRKKIIQQLEEGGAIALVSDAGTPLISDPGYKLVRDAQEAAVDVVPIPGASAAIAALSIAGIPTDRFLFEGFLPNKEAARQAMLKAAPNDVTRVYYERGSRVPALLRSVCEALDVAQPVIIAREITKQYEEVIRGTAQELAQQTDASPLKGEVVLMLPPHAITMSEDEVDALLNKALETMKTKQAAAHVAEQTGLPKNTLYKRALELSDGK